MAGTHRRAPVPDAGAPGLSKTELKRRFISVWIVLSSAAGSQRISAIASLLCQSGSHAARRIKSKSLAVKYCIALVHKFETGPEPSAVVPPARDPAAGATGSLRAWFRVRTSGLLALTDPRLPLVVLDRVRV